MAKNIIEKSYDFIEKFGIAGGQFKGGECISTGHFALDFVLKYGCLPTEVDLDSVGYDPSVSLGIPLGVLAEISGTPGSGKSSLAYRLAGNAQKRGFNVAWIDAENSFSEALADINGCDAANIMTVQKICSAEEYLEIIKSLIRIKKTPFTLANGKVEERDAPKVIVLDSVASLVPEKIRESEAGKATMALLASLLSDQVREICNLAIENQVLVVFINQLRKTLAMWGPAEKTSGGEAIPFYSSVRLKLSQIKSKEAKVWIEDDQTGEKILVAGKSKVKFEKNKLGKPYFEQIEIPIYYEKYSPGISSFAFAVGRQLKLINVRNNIFKWKGGLPEGVESKRGFIAALSENSLLNKLIFEIVQEAEKTKTTLPPEIIRYIKTDDYLKYEEQLQKEESSLNIDKEKDEFKIETKQKKTTKKKTVKNNATTEK